MTRFPEGSVNRRDPRKLQSFRRGSFALPIKYKKPVYGVLNVGCEDTWPVGAPAAGIPASIFLRVVKICDDASVFAEPAVLAEFAQTTMQAELDSLYAQRDSETAVGSLL